MLTASVPVGNQSTGDQATFMPMGPATMIMLAASKPNFGGGGQIIFSGVPRPGTYSVGAAQGPGDAQGATLTIENQSGQVHGLSTADGGTSSFDNRPIQYPPAAALTIISSSGQEIAGHLNGLFFISGGPGPQLGAHVQVRLDFRAAAMTAMSTCQSP
jgi:hypothetical protein